MTNPAEKIVKKYIKDFEYGATLEIRARAQKSLKLLLDLFPSVKTKETDD